MDEEQPALDVGWMVLDPDGNIVDSGPGIALEMTTEIGGTEQDGEINGGD